MGESARHQIPGVTEILGRQLAHRNQADGRDPRGHRALLHMVVVRISIVERDVPCLLSRPAMALLSIVLDMGNNSMIIGALGDTRVPLVEIETGHVAVAVLGTVLHIKILK